MKTLTKRQKSTVKSIGRYAYGFSSYSKAHKTHQQLVALGLLEIKTDGVQLTPSGLEVAKALLK